MNLETLALHAGYEKDSQGTMAVPIYMSTAYEFHSSQHAADLFSLKELGNIYTRLTNPTNAIYEKRFAEVEGGVAAVSTASGMSAIFSAIVNLCEVGDNILVSSSVYGGTTTLTDHTLKRFGIEARKFDVTDGRSLEKLIDHNTKLVLFESLSNPTLKVADFESIVTLTNRHKIITVVDNTVATPFLCRPLELGCDIVVHSASKYTTGQGLALGGIIIEGKSTQDKIKQNQRYYHFNEPDASYHGLVYSELPFPAFMMRMVLCVLRDLGATASPFNSWLMIQGLETLALRMEQHSQSALEIARFLESHPKVLKVNYPGLESDENSQRAQKYLQKGASGILSFEVASYDAAQKILDTTELFSLVANIGDSKSIMTHPASMTHQQLSKKELQDVGIGEGLIRVSVGLEHTQDLINDLQKAI